MESPGGCRHSLLDLKPADPDPGEARDYGIYAVLEQKLRIENDDDRGMGIFARTSYSPPDRNLIYVYAMPPLK